MRLFAPRDTRPRQRCSPIAIATPSGVAISIVSPASLSVLPSAVCSSSSCHTDAGSSQYHRIDIDWNAERLLPELNEIRTAISTGTSDHRTYSHVMRREGSEPTTAHHRGSLRCERAIVTR